MPGEKYKVCVASVWILFLSSSCRVAVLLQLHTHKLLGFVVVVPSYNYVVSIQFKIRACRNCGPEKGEFKLQRSVSVYFTQWTNNCDDQSTQFRRVPIVSLRVRKKRKVAVDVIKNWKWLIVEAFRYSLLNSWYPYCCCESVRLVDDHLWKIQSGWSSNNWLCVVVNCFDGT